nr:hypothetical protein [uncultured Sphaerochaeta sp.]
MKDNQEMKETSFICSSAAEYLSLIAVTDRGFFQDGDKVSQEIARSHTASDFDCFFNAGNSIDLDSGEDDSGQK